MKLHSFLLCTALAAAPIFVGATPVVAEDKKPYVIYLSNNFVGNVSTAE